MALLQLIPVPAFAHHASPIYNPAKSVTMKCTVTKVEWANPHVLIFFDVNGDGGRTEAWHAATEAPARLTHLGWSSDTLKPGDSVTVTGMPDKSGSHEIWIVKVGLSDGRQLDLHEPRLHLP